MELSVDDFKNLMDAISDLKESNAGIKENQINLQRTIVSFQQDLKDTDARLRSVESTCNRERQWDDYIAVKADLYDRIRYLEAGIIRATDLAGMLDDLNRKLDAISGRVASLEEAVRSHTVEDKTEKAIFERFGDKWWAVALVVLTVIITLGAEGILTIAGNAI